MHDLLHGMANFSCADLVPENYVSHMNIIV